MAYTGYTKTEKNAGAKWNGWLWLRTYINQNPERTMRRQSSGSQHFIRDWTTEQKIYCHQNAAPEPVADGHIKTVIFDDAETEYSGGVGYIKSFTSSSGIFTSNQDLSIQPQWTAYFTAKNTGLTSGYIGHFKLEIYKRNTSNNDTLLFSTTYYPIPTVYSAAGLSLVLSPAGTVTISDRLRIRVYMFEKLPI